MVGPIAHVPSLFLRDALPAIRARRRLLHLTQADVAAAAGVSTRFIGLLESGKSTVRLDYLERVLDVLGFRLTLVSHG